VFDTTLFTDAVIIGAGASATEVYGGYSERISRTGTVSAANVGWVKADPSFIWVTPK
jgi:hypothetical protein